MFLKNQLYFLLEKIPRILRKSLAYLITSILTFKALAMALEPKASYEWALIIFVTAFVTSAEMMFFSHGHVDWIKSNYARATFKTVLGVFFASISIGASVGYFYTSQESSQETHKQYEKKVAELDSLKATRNRLLNKTVISKTFSLLQPEINRLEAEIKELKKQPDSQKSVGNAFAEKISKITGMDEGTAGFYVVFYLAIILEIGCIYVYCFDEKIPVKKAVIKNKKRVQKPVIPMTDSVINPKTNDNDPVIKMMDSVINSVTKTLQESKLMTEKIDDKNDEKKDHKTNIKKEDKNLQNKILPFFDKQDLIARKVMAACITTVDEAGIPMYAKIAKDLKEIEICNKIVRQDIHRIYNNYLSQKDFIEKIMTTLSSNQKISLQDLSLKLQVKKTKKLQRNYMMALGILDGKRELKKSVKKTKMKD